MTRTLAPSSRSGPCLAPSSTSTPEVSLRRRKAGAHRKMAQDCFLPQGGIQKRSAAACAPAMYRMQSKHEDCFQPAPVRDTTHRTPLHEAIRDHKLQEVQRLVAKGVDLDAQDSRGQTALHYAVSRDYVNLAQLLLAHGARPDMADALGDTPLHTAARYSADGATWLLAKHLEKVETPVLPYPTRAEVHAILTAHVLPRRRERYAFFDRITEALSGTQRDLNAHDAVLKYVGHLMSMRGVAAGRVNAEGWQFDAFLFQRLRSLVAMYYTSESLSHAANGLLSGTEMAQVLAQEIQRVLRSLIFVRHITSQEWVTKKPRELLEHYEARTILHAIRTLAPDDELTLPVGTSHHAIYLNLRPMVVNGTPVVRLRVDNLGWGWNWGHFALEKNGRIGPFAVNIPQQYFNDPAQAEGLQALFVGIMRRMHDNKDDIDVFYAQLAHLEHTLSTTYGTQTTRTMTDPCDTYWKTKQTSGNCVLKNHSVGVWARLGAALSRKLGDADPRLPDITDALWRAFKENESELALDRLWNFVMTPSVFRERDCASKTAKLQKLLRDKKSRQNGLVSDFLRKPNRATIGAELTAEDLCPLVTDGDLETLQELLIRGVDLSRESHHRAGQESLLHVAVRSSAPTAPQMIKLLLRNKVPGNAEDGAGETPYALAARLRHGEALMALLEAGVVEQGTPEALANLQACLQRQLDDTARALAMLHAQGIAPSGAIDP